jgi:hypothetical protein
MALCHDSVVCGGDSNEQFKKNPFITTKLCAKGRKIVLSTLLTVVGPADFQI